MACRWRAVITKANCDCMGIGKKNGVATMGMAVFVKGTMRGSVWRVMNALAQRVCDLLWAGVRAVAAEKVCMCGQIWLRWRKEI